MPLKTDGILFELHPRPTKGEDGRPLLYAQPVIERKHDMDDIDDFCFRYRHTSRGEMQRLFSLLEEVTTMWLSQGHRVETPFGSFAPKLRLLGDHTEPARVTGSDVVYGGVEFIPSRQFVGDADCSLEGFRRKKGRVSSSQAGDAKAMEQALGRSMVNGYITISNFMWASGLKYNSAKNYLDSLCRGADPRLRCYQEGRTWHYVFLRDVPEEQD